MARKKIQTIDVDATVIETPAEPSLFEQLSNWLNEHDWSFDASDAQDRVSFSLLLKDASVRVHCWIYDTPDWKRLSAYTAYPTRVPAHRRAEVALALARINYETAVGCFEMDANDGEVRTRCWHETPTAVHPEMIDRVVRRCLDLADQYQAPLLAIAFGNAAADQVIEMGKRAEQKALQ